MNETTIKRLENDSGRKRAQNAKKKNVKKIKIHKVNEINWREKKKIFHSRPHFADIENDACLAWPSINNGIASSNRCKYCWTEKILLVTIPRRLLGQIDFVKKTKRKQQKEK